MLAFRLAAFTGAVMVLVLWLASTGRPFGGLVIVPIVAIWLRRAAESGRLTRFARRLVRLS
jgi:hypothetical protein